MNQTVSLKEIAEKAHVSPATVSRVMNKNGRYSKETEERVLRIIEECGYAPNQLARGLRMSRSHIVGIIVPDITNEFFAKLIQVIQNRLFDFDYPVAIYNTNESKFTEKKCLRYLRAQNVSGVIYINGNEDIEGDSLDDIPVIYVDRKPAELPKSKTKYISSDNRRGGYIATREMLDKGCRRIAVMTERFGTYVMTERLTGYAEALNEAGIEADPSLIFKPELISYESAFSIVEEKIKNGVEFDGIFCQTDWLASGAIAALKRCGKKVPNEVKVVGFDNISISYLCYQPFTTIEQDIASIGNYLANAIMGMIDDTDRDGPVRVFPVNLIRRQTT